MSKRILVVEDQPDNRQIIRDMLAGTDYEIMEAKNGEQALAAVAKARPDLILMGIQLPIMDGYEVTRQIKADPAMRSIPIIAVASALKGFRTQNKRTLIRGAMLGQLHQRQARTSNHACKLGCKASAIYRRDRSPLWLKVKNPNAPAVNARLRKIGEVGHKSAH